MLRHIVGGFGLGAVVFTLTAGITSACGGPVLLQCRAEAVALLPLEPDQITLGDLKEVARRVKACQAADGGP